MSVAEALLDARLRGAVLAAAFVLSAGAGLVARARDPEGAARRGAQLDARRRGTAGLYRRLSRPHGALRAGLVVLGGNLLGGALLVSSIGGLALLPPLALQLHLGRLLALTATSSRERLVGALCVLPFEWPAFVLAGVGGTGVGAALLVGGDAGAALRTWAWLFGAGVVPLLALGAVVEACWMHRTYVVRGVAPPAKAADDATRSATPEAARQQGERTP